MMVSGDVVGTLPCFKRTSIQKRRIPKQQEKNNMIFVLYLQTVRGKYVLMLIAADCTFEAQASAVSSYLYRNSPETQTHLVFNLIDRNMTKKCMVKTDNQNKNLLQN